MLSSELLGDIRFSKGVLDSVNLRLLAFQSAQCSELHERPPRLFQDLFDLFS